MAVYELTDYLALPCPEETFLVENLVPQGGSALIYGDPKAGKSSLALQLCDAVADSSKTEFLGLAVRAHGPVVYVQVDTSPSLWHHQIKEHFVPAGMLKGVYFADMNETPFPFDILDKGGECEKWLRDSIAPINPVMVVIDTLREIHSGDENDSGHMKVVMSKLAEICRPAALVILTHAKKPQANSTMELIGGARGSSFIAGKVDTILRVSDGYLLFQSRSAGETKISTFRTPVLFERADDVTPKLEKLVSSNPKASLATLTALAVDSIPSLTPEAARSRLRRLLVRTGV